MSKHQKYYQKNKELIKEKSKQYYVSKKLEEKEKIDKFIKSMIPIM